MKNFTLGILALIYENQDENCRILIPKGVITGVVNKDGIGEYIHCNNQKYYKFDNNLEANECYIFPINSETLMNEYLDVEALEDADYIEKDYLEEIMSTYVAEVIENMFYSKYNYVSDDEKFYRVDVTNDGISEIDPRLDFWKALKNEIPLTEKIEFEDNETEEMISDFDYKEVASEVKRVVKGQDEPLDQILVSLKKHILSNGKLKSTMLVTGESGSGKTEIFRNVCRLLNIDYVIADATKFTQEGYVGDNVSEMLRQLYDRSGRKLAKAQRGLLIVDEIDKKANKNFHELVSSKGVLDGLLKIMEGGKINVSGIGEFDTSNLIFVALGAFDGIRNDLDDKVVGFNRENKKSSGNKILQTEDFIRYGLTHEFIGRFSTLITLNKLTVDVLVDILLNSDASILKINQEFLADCFNIKLNCSDDYIKTVVKNSEKLKIGARGLNRIVEQSLFIAMKEILENNIKNKELVLTEKTVENPKVYTLK